MILNELMWHSLMHGWSSARSFHYQFLRELEMDNFTCANQNEMVMMSLTAAHENTNSLDTNHAAVTTNRVRTEHPSYRSEDGPVA